jgi:mannose-6-phosphate isomerase-like protein (cupin superfamily)
MKERVVFRAGEGPIHQLRPDFAGLVIAGEHATLVRWDIPANREPISGLHSHEAHEQFCIVLSGDVEMVVGDETIRLGQGDACRIPRRVRHGRTKALNGKPAVVLDVFAPRRPEYETAPETEVT